MKRLLWIAAALCFLPSIAFAQQAETRPFFYKKDITVTAVSYGRFLPVQGPVQGVGTVTSTSTTLAADAPASQTPFSQITVGSIIQLQTGTNTFNTYVVTAKASDVSLTLDGSPGVTAVPWRFQYFVAGTGATAGWLPALVSDYAAVEIDATTLNGSTTLNYRIECQLDGLATNPALLTTGSISAASTFIVPLAENCNNVRVGFFWSSSATGTDVVSAYLNTKRFTY